MVFYMMLIQRVTIYPIFDFINTYDNLYVFDRGTIGDTINKKKYK